MLRLEPETSFCTDKTEQVPSLELESVLLCTKKLSKGDEELSDKNMCEKAECWMTGESSTSGYRVSLTAHFNLLLSPKSLLTSVCLKGSWTRKTK